MTLNSKLFEKTIHISYQIFEWISQHSYDLTDCNSIESIKAIKEGNIEPRKLDFNEKN